MAVTTSRGGNIQRAGSGGGLVEIIDRVLDKGIVIDAWVRVSLVGIELLTIEARVVIASVDTYLKYAEAIGATQLASRPQPAMESAQAPQQQIPQQAQQPQIPQQAPQQPIPQQAPQQPIPQQAPQQPIPQQGASPQGPSQ